jgi:WD40 repeat protein
MASHALHVYQSAYVTMPHCLLLDTLSQAHVPPLRHSLVSPRAPHWASHTHDPHMFCIMLRAVSLGELTPVEICQGPGPCPYRPVAVSPASDVIASGMGSGVVPIMDPNTLSVISATNVHHSPVSSIAFSPEGSEIASGSENPTVRIRRVAAVEEQPAPFPGHESMVHRAAVSPDCSRLVTGGADSTVRLWDVLTCAELAVLRGHEHRVGAVTFSTDGSRVVSGSADSTIRVWDALQFREIAVIKGHQGDVSFVACAPDDALIASCSADGTVRLWCSATQQELAQMKSHTDTVYCVAFSPANGFLASVSGDRTVRVWDVVAFTQVAELVIDRGGFLAKSLEFSLDGKTIRTWGQEHEPGPEWISDAEHGGANHLALGGICTLTATLQRSGRRS